MGQADLDASFWHCACCRTPNPRAAYLITCLGCGAPGTATGGPHPPRRAATRLGRWTLASCWAFAASLLALIATVEWLGDRWWPATALLFGPHWIWGLPFFVLVPAALAWRRRALWPLVASATLFLGPWMGLCLPWRAERPRPHGEPRTLRVLTCNVHYSNSDRSALRALIAEQSPDLVLFQEWGHRYPANELFDGPGWRTRAEGEFLFACRAPIGGVEVIGHDRWGRPTAAVRAVVRMPWGNLPVANLHPASPRSGLSALRYNPLRGGAALQDNIALRGAESEVTSVWLGDLGPAAIIAGDFNLPVESAIFRRWWSRYADAFSVAGLGFGHTWFSRWHGLRIDHVLAGPGWRVRRCWVGPDVGSDHRPLLADLIWAGEG